MSARLTFLICILLASAAGHLHGRRHMSNQSRISGLPTARDCQWRRNVFRFQGWHLVIRGHIVSEINLNSTVGSSYFIGVVNFPLPKNFLLSQNNKRFASVNLTHIYHIFPKLVPLPHVQKYLLKLSFY